MLTISAEREAKKEEKDKRFMRREFNYSSFTRSFALPEILDAEKITAKHKDGVLHVVIPKKEEAREKAARTISIS